jgi:murein DD-endopeptidase MepM/ murein hydrolase activator NlpD
MSWEQVQRRMLQPVWDNEAQVTHVPHMTSPPGLRWRKDLQKLEDHPGADLNYEGGQALPLNRSRPAIRSPVTGVVTRAGEGDYGTIAIQDENGLSHQILHTHSRHVSVGDPVVAGQLIGTMGNTGVNRRGVEGGDFHVHYQIKDRAGSRVNPVEYWDQQGPIDPSPP